MVGHGRNESPHLSVGICCTGCGALALREAASGRLLAVDHYFRRRAGSGSVCNRGDDPRPGVAARDVPRIRQALADSKPRNSDSGQSVGGGSWGTSGGFFFSEEKREKAGNAGNGGPPPE